MTELRLPLSRRMVLGGTAAASGVAVFARPGMAFAGPRRRPVIGVLTSTRAAQRGTSPHGAAFVAGLKVGLNGSQKKVLHAEVVGGYAGLVPAAEKLIGSGARVIVAAVSEAKAPHLVELCTRRKVALVMAGAGAQVAAPTTVGGRPAALHTSAQHWQSSMSMGGWAARKLGSTLHHVVAAPDAGYDSVYALRRGFTGAGGTVVGLSLTHEGDGLGDTVREIKASRPKVIAISASGARASQIARALRAGGVKGRFVLDPTCTDALAGFRGAADGAHAGGVRVDPARRKALAAALRRQGAGAPTAASILGHDTGLLIATGLARLGSRPWTRLPARLVGVTVPGVRGAQKVDAHGRVTVPLAVVKVRKKGRRRSVVTVATRARVRGTAPAMSVVQGRMSSGYLNEYATS